MHQEDKHPIRKRISIALFVKIVGYYIIAAVFPRRNSIISMGSVQAFHSASVIG